MILWLDLETTGLDPLTCHVLQVGMKITQDDLTPVYDGEYEEVVWQPQLNLEGLHPVVQKMHTENGLLEQSRTAKRGIRSIELSMIDFTADLVKPILAGNSIHFDRRFLIRHFPEFEALLHYRMIDVSTIKELASRWGIQMPEKGPPAHTALADVNASIAELKHYMDLFKGVK